MQSIAELSENDPLSVTNPHRAPARGGRSSRQRGKKGRHAALRAALFDALEPRVLFSTIVVNTISDTGGTSLRGAVTQANASATATTITFDPTVFATSQTITLSGTALELTNTAHATSIVGPAAGVTVSANDLSAVFIVDGGVTASMSGITASHGNSGGITNHGSLTLTSVTVSDNSNAASGGGIFSDGTLSLSGCTVTANTFAGVGDSSPSSGGGAGIFSSGTATLTNCTLSNNTYYSSSDTAGGGGFYNAGNATLTDCTVSGNIGTSGLAIGAGIFNTATLTLVRDTLSGNSSYNDAGGLENTGTATLTNVTIANNSAQEPGGGIENFGTLSLSFVTIFGNSATLGGGIFTQNGFLPPFVQAIVTVGNTIIAGNTEDPGFTGPGDVLGAFTSQGNNLIGATDGGTGWISSDLTGSAGNPLNPGLGALANNGGPTQTLLPTNSPALQAGSIALIPGGVTTDQRGLPRTTANRVDIGAVEVQQQAGLSITNLAVTSSVVFGVDIPAIPNLAPANNVISGDSVTYTVTVSNTAGTAANNVQVSDPLPAGLALTSNNPSVGAYNAASGIWTVGTLGGGQAAALSLVAQVTAGLGSITTSAVVTSGTTNPNSAFNTASETVFVVPLPPTLRADAYVTTENTPLTVDAASGVLANDLGAGPLFAGNAQTPSSATTVQLNPNGSFTFTPATDFTGTETFTYGAHVTPNGQSSNAGMVTITVNAPQVQKLDSAVILTASAATVADGDSVTLTATVAPSLLGGAHPTGTVDFLAGAILLGTVPVGSDGNAVLSTPLPLGPGVIIASYSGNGTYSAKASAAISATVVALSTPAPVGIIAHKQVRLAPFTLADGTPVTVTITGGSGTVAHGANSVRLTLAGSPRVKIRTQGGTNSFTLSSATGATNLSSFDAPTARLLGVLSAGRLGSIKMGSIFGLVQSAGAISSIMANDLSGGAISCAGILGTVRIGTVSGTIAAAKIRNITAASFSNATILAGANLGSDGAMGGTGVAADIFTAGQILSLRVNGAISGSFIEAGIDPGVDGSFLTSDDIITAGKSRIGAITVKRAVDSNTHFESASFPKVARLPGKVTTATDSRFIVPGHG